MRLRRADGTPVGVYCGVGTFSDRQVVGIESAVPVPPETPPEIVALLSCGATTGIGAVFNTAQVRPGQSAVVIGGGGVGLSVVIGAATAGAYPVIVVARSRERLRIATEAGATHVFLAAGESDSDADALDVQQLRQAVNDVTGGGADHAFEAVGRPDTEQLALDLTRPGGILTLVGMTPQGQLLGLDVYEFIGSGRQIRASNSGSTRPFEELPRLARMYLAGRLPLDLLVSARIRLAEINEAFEAMRQGKGARNVILY